MLTLSHKIALLTHFITERVWRQELAENISQPGLVVHVGPPFRPVDY